MSMIFSDLVNRLTPPEKLEEEVLERKIHIEEKISYIQQLLIDRIRISFKKVMDSAESKTEIIVSFLALLELIKQRSVSVDQDELFSDITITSVNNLNTFAI